VRNEDREARAYAKSAVVCGAGGFIASHLVKRLKAEGYWVRQVDIKTPEFSMSAADDFEILDLRQVRLWPITD
jgi:nucleoside-diphosphate-sugar epimerase